MKAGRLLLCILTLALTLYASRASANPAPACSSSCDYETPCSAKCSIFANGTYMNVTCGYYGVCAL